MVKPIALTLGEPAGIGPDITIAAWLRRKSDAVPPFYLLGDSAFIAARAKLLGLDLPLLDLPLAEVGQKDVSKIFTEALPIAATGHPATAHPGHPDDNSAAAAIGSIRQAVNDVVAGHAGAVVTNPIAKSVLYRAGFAHPGHTEFLAELAAANSNAPQPVMLLGRPILR